MVWWSEWLVESDDRVTGHDGVDELSPGGQFGRFELGIGLMHADFEQGPGILGRLSEVAAAGL